MENAATTEVRMLESVGAAQAGALQAVPSAWIGQAAARLQGDSSVNAIQAGGLGVQDHVQFDLGAYGQASIPDFSWLSPAGPETPSNNVQAPARSGGTAGPGDAPGKAQGNEGSWSMEDEQMLDKAIESGASEGASGGQDYNQIFGQFGQSQEGNCASVAVIKAAMDKYKGKVFQSVTKSGQGYDITMQDNKKVQVSKDELKKGAKAADLKGKPSEMKSMAVLMFTAMAKRGSESGMGNFDAVLKDMNNGFDPLKSAELLGLKDKVQKVDPKAAGNGDGVVAWDNKHAVYVDEGKTDSYGQAKSFDGTNTRGGKLTQAFTFAA